MTQNQLDSFKTLEEYKIWWQKEDISFFFKLYEVLFIIDTDL